MVGYSWWRKFTQRLGFCRRVQRGSSCNTTVHLSLTIRNLCHWTLTLLIPLCLGWVHGRWNCQWWLVLALLGSAPILQCWFGGGWRFSFILKCSYLCFRCRWHDMFDYSRDNYNGTIFEIWLVIRGEENLRSGSAFVAVFREVGWISVKCKYHYTFMVLYGRVRMGWYIVK